MKSRVEQIFETINDYDSLVEFPHGKEHVILPEHYRQLATNIDKNLNEVNLESVLVDFADYWNRNGNNMISPAHVFNFLKSRATNTRASDSP